MFLHLYLKMVAVGGRPASLLSAPLPLLLQWGVYLLGAWRDTAGVAVPSVFIIAFSHCLVQHIALKRRNMPVYCIVCIMMGTLREIFRKNAGAMEARKRK